MEIKVVRELFLMIMQVYKDIFATVSLLVGGALAGYGEYLIMCELSVLVIQYFNMLCLNQFQIA